MNLLREKLRATGAHRLLCADAPDMSGANAAALRNAEISQEALDWYKQIYKDSAPDRARASEAALAQAGVQTDLARFALQRSRDEANRYDTTFKPIEAKIAADARTYDTPARREAEARQAVADTQIALANARDSSRRALERRGVMPGSGASLALEGTQNLGAAKLNASAANSARDRVEAVGAAKMMDAAGLGRGVVTNQATQAEIGLRSGNSAIANAQVPLNVAAQGAQIGGQGFQTAIQGNQSAANINLGMAGVQSGVDQANAATAGAAGTAIGAIAIAI